MNKEEYLQKLESYLKKHLSKSEVEDIIRDYGEYFDDGRRRNKTDLEIAAKLGDPQTIAEQFWEEYQDEKKATRPSIEVDAVMEKTRKGAKKVSDGAKAAAHGIGKGIENLSSSIKQRPKKEHHPFKGLCWCMLRFGKFLKRILMALLSIFGLLFICAALTMGVCVTITLAIGSIALLITSSISIGLLSPFFSAAGFFLAICIFSISAIFGIYLRRGFKYLYTTIKNRHRQKAKNISHREAYGS